MTTCVECGIKMGMNVPKEQPPMTFFKSHGLDYCAECLLKKEQQEVRT